MKKIIKILQKREFSVVLFFLSFFLFFWPFLSMPDEDPGEMFTYFFIAWGIVILLLWLNNRSVIEDVSSEDSQESKNGKIEDV